MNMQQRLTESILMTSAVMLTRGGRPEQEDAAAALCWAWDQELLAAGDVAKVVSSLVDGGANDLAQVRRYQPQLAQPFSVVYFRKQRL